ncbi:outer membrane lipoprotein chaperone LolA [Aquincola sp. MAHUQ-54]|uniref:Outer-membrane lipoprotein carrier protein n=1 Tax=Aquincola agrisoli TaxID=3119538 RepID=A0AAW9Q9F5_9BURK
MNALRPWLGASACLVVAMAAVAMPAHADAVDTLREFVRDVKTGRADFTQTVTSPDGAKKKVSTGQFEFARPDRFRFAYAKPFEQLVVGDGQQVWLYDADLNQVSVRGMSGALGATPAALLAGKSLDQDFELSAQPSAQGLDWALATPKQKDGAFQSLRVGFRGKVLAAVEIVDGFGQRSVLEFRDMQTNVALGEQAFRFVPPKGAEVLKQP